MKTIEDECYVVIKAYKFTVYERSFGIIILQLHVLTL